MNVTPDSFSDGGQFLRADAAVAHGMRLVDEGADWLDIGGESTRPGSSPVPVPEQLARVVPVVRALARVVAVPISIDTTSLEVARAALDAGARVINDVSGLADPRLATLAAERGADLVVMHCRGTPADMQRDVHYDDVVREVVAFLRDRAATAMAAGVPPERLVVDPGLGFGKAAGDNPRLVAAIATLRGLGHRVLVGGSRKAFVGQLTGEPDAASRVHGSVGVALAAALLGAELVRVHDVRATAQALATFLACVPPAVAEVPWSMEDRSDGVGTPPR